MSLPPVLLHAKEVVHILHQAGHLAYFAGGWVRDFLMQHPSDDIDIATSASVEQVQTLFPKTIPVGVAFGIVIVVQGGSHFEVATFRKDRGYSDGRRPTGIDPAAPEEDAKRRDFTVNGLFYDPIQERLFDYVGGQQDIEKKLIRAIGDPHERFAEDRLRMMRAVRYSTRFDFPIEEATAKAIAAHATELLPSVAMERVWQEFKKMSQFAHFDKGLVLLHKLNLLPTIFPSLQNVSTEEVELRTQVIAHFPRETPPIGAVLELFPEISLEEILALSDQLKTSKQERELALFLHRTHSLFGMPPQWIEKLEPIEWAQFYAHPSAWLSLQILSARYPEEKRTHFLKEHETKSLFLARWIERIRTQNPLVRAVDLVQRGIPPGKEMGELLRLAEKIAVNQNLDDKEAVLRQLLP